jgi:two-component system nitrogen regulation sensor histidine kinase NtrY
MPTRTAHRASTGPVVPGVVLLALAIAVTCAAIWTRSPQVGYLIGSAAATMLCAVAAVRAGRPLATRVGMLVAFAALGGWLALAVQGQRDVTGTVTNGEQAVLAQAEVDARRIASAIDVARERLRELLGALDVRTASSIHAPVIAGVETAVALMDGDRVVSSDGLWRVPPPSASELARDTVRLITTPLYRVLLLTRREGTRAAHAAVLLHALPPMDRVARGVVNAEVGTVGARRIVVGTDATLAAFSGGDAASARSGRELLIAARLPTPAIAELLAIERARLRTLPLLVIALLAVLVIAGRRPTTLWRRLAASSLVVTVVGILPLSALSNQSTLMDAGVFFVPGGGPWTGNLAALMLTTVAMLVGIIYLTRARLRLPRAVALGGVVLCAVAGPFVVRNLSRGITPPTDSVPTSLWLAWQLALALVALVLALVGLTLARSAVPALPSPVRPWVASVIAIGLSVAAPLVWRAPAGWPDWYTVPWMLALGALAASARRPRAVLHAALVSGCAAATIVWGATARRAVEQAEQDVSRLRTIDEDAARLLERFGWSLLQQPLPDDASGLLAAYGASDLAAAGFRASLAVWRPDGGAVPIAAVTTSTLAAPPATMFALAERARQERVPLLVSVDGEQAMLLALAVADSQGTAITMSVAPRTLIGRDVAVAPLVGEPPVVEARVPYRLAFTSVSVSEGAQLDQPVWTRQGARLVGDWLTRLGEGVSQVHAEVDLRTWDGLLPRAILLVAFDVAVALVLAALVLAADGGVLRWVRWRWTRVRRSYRARLTSILALFFALPAALFALWTVTRVRDDDRQARAALAREALRVVPSSGVLPVDGTVRFLYRDRLLRAASDGVLLAAAPFGVVLDDALVRELVEQRRPSAEETRLVEDARERSTVLAYRALAPAASVVVMAPAVRDDGAFATRRDDLLVLVLAATLIGVLGAGWLGGRVARELERPVDALRQAVLQLPAPAAPRGAVPAEFVPAFEAVERTGQALTESRNLLESARARTDAVLRNVASAVVAFDEEGQLLLTNPRADAMRTELAMQTGGVADWPEAVQRRVQASLARAVGELREDEPFSFDLADRQWQGRLSRLSAGGVVVTLDDVTDLARAERVIAWGEMARQVAHEIKNPLTPVRLGIQHLRRAWRDGRGDFGALLETNVDRILTEIDHLDQIARQFSRFGAPSASTGGADDGDPLESVDLVAVVHNVVRLETMGEPTVRWLVEVEGTIPSVQARAGELHEVLLNLCENARLADARTVTLRLSMADQDGTVRLAVEDDGTGIAAEHLPRIFEPRFSTRTSGTGLGLAICRRLVMSWGGAIDVASTPATGTTVSLRLREADSRDRGKVV